MRPMRLFARRARSSRGETVSFAQDVDAAYMRELAGKEKSAFTGYARVDSSQGGKKFQKT